ncbi:MAG: cupredoxin domain-containing protein [Gammaproteobacteria bacterium]|nr:cupredoxin domain-containing protein [Gammaproteobacteria bacterium]
MEQVIVNVVGFVVMGLIIWWFWIAKPKLSRADTDVVEILVDNGVYTPSRIEVPTGQRTTLRFLRKDASPCAEKVLFDDLGISADLPVDETRDEEVEPSEPGEYEFTCQMRMYRGSLVAR